MFSSINTQPTQGDRTGGDRVEQRPSLPASVGSGLRRQVEHSAALHSLLYSTPALTARRTAARTARRLAPQTADRLIAEIKGTEPLLARVRLAAAHTRRRGAALRASAALTVAAVVGGMVVGATPASAADGPGVSTAPTAHDGAARKGTTGSTTGLNSATGLTAADSAAAAHDVTMPQIYPRAQSQTAYGQSFTVPATVTLVLAAKADPGAVAAVRELLLDAGVRRLVQADGGAAAAPGTLTVYVGGIAEGVGGGADRALRGLAAAGGAQQAPLTPAGLPSGGYVLASGLLAVPGGRAAAIVLAGVDADGTYNAAQSLRELVTSAPGGVAAVPGVRVQDWPSTPVRGTEEGFNGTPWTTQQTLSELDFLGRTKQNFVLYAPGEDPYRSTQWRQPYPAAQAAALRTMAQRAALDQVTFGYALSLGQSVCYTSEQDQDALIAKLDSLWKLGVRAFQLQFTDVSYDHWNCRQDLDHYGQGPASAARAQSDLVAVVLKRFSAKHPGAAPLSVLPSEYYQSGATPYRTALAKDLDPSVQVAWTGVGVQPAIITAGDVSATQQAFQHPLVTQDNYPVNDSEPDRLYLGPYVGRDPSVGTGSAALLVNAMEEPLASRIPLATAADFGWNPVGYDPQSSWQGAIAALAAPTGAGAPGSAQAPSARTTAALDALAGNSASSPLGQPESAYLQPLLAAFWSEQGADGSAAGLRAAFSTMAQAPQALAGLDGGALSSEDGPWLAQLALYGQAGQTAVDMLTAERAGQGSTAWSLQLRLQQLTQQLSASAQTVTVGAGVLLPFLKRALASSTSWAGLDGNPVTATTTMGSALDDDPSQMVDGDPGSYYWSDNPPQVGDSVGVDLGSVQPVGEVRITLGGTAGSDAEGDWFQDAVLEYSTGDGSWHTISTDHDQQTVDATLPPGTRARYVRLRATATQDDAVAVREFSVTAPVPAGQDETVTADGPPAQPGSPAANVVDGSLQTAYRAAAAPRAGDALTVSLGRPRPLDQVVVLTAASVRAAGWVEVDQPGKGWVKLGALTPGYTQLPADPKLAVDRIRLVWAAGDAAPVVYQVVPWYADTPVAALQLPQQSVDLEPGGTATLPAEVQALGTGRVSGTLRAQLPATARGLAVQAARPVTLARGGQVATALDFTAGAATAPGDYSVPVSFVADGRSVTQLVQVRVHPLTTGPDLALTATPSASGDLSADFMSAEVNDGDPTTRWASPAGINNSWVELQLARPATLGKVVLRWDAAYAAQYLVQTSTDGVNWSTAASVLDGQGGEETLYLDAADVGYVRMQGVAPGTANGYSLDEIELYAVAGTGAGSGPGAGGGAGGGSAGPGAPGAPGLPGAPGTGSPTPTSSTTPSPTPVGVPVPPPGDPGGAPSPPVAPTSPVTPPAPVGGQ
jgi:hyaluronoglucosaminidase